MSDTTVIENTDQAANAAEQSVITFASLNDVKRKYFAPDEIQEFGNAYIAAINAIPGVRGTEANQFRDSKIVTNFPKDYQFGGDDGYGLGVIPVGKQTGGEQGNVITRVVIAAVPDPDVILTTDDGTKFVRDTLTTAFFTKLGNAARSSKDGMMNKLPFSVKEFITSARGKESLKTFTELAPEMVSALKKKGIKYMTTNILKQCLQSAAFAESQFGGKIPQEKWELIINVMIKRARDKGLDPAVLENWLETRDQKVDDMDIDTDFSDFEELAA